MNPQPPQIPQAPHAPQTLENYIVGQKEIARYMGCSTSTIKRWVRSGRLPVSKIGEGRTGKIAVSIRALDRWIRKRGIHRLTPDAATAANPAVGNPPNAVKSRGQP